jgi:hypothetical protein
MKLFPATIISILLAGGFFAPSFAAAGAEALPLVQQADLEYLGAFRLPREGTGAAEGFSFGGYPLAFNPAHNSLFVGTRAGGVGEVSIPLSLARGDVESLPFASMLQPVASATNGGIAALPEGGVRGFLVEGERLFGAASIYYDANNNARVSHFVRSTDLSDASIATLKPLWQAEKSGFVGGWLASVPEEWQEALGGNVISGNCCVPIVSRTSHGPAAFAWNTANFDQPLVPASPLLYYPGEEETLGTWGSANEVYGGTTDIGGMVIPAGTRSLLYFGLNGTGEFCYGTGGASGGECYDPLSSDKGQHAYPYRYQVWAYDLNDLVAVKVGARDPWDVRPYAVWTLGEFPATFIPGIGGVAYDAERRIVYVAQARADQDGYSSRSLVHAFRVTTASSLIASPPVSAAPAAPSQSGGGRGSAPAGVRASEDSVIVALMTQLIAVLKQMIAEILRVRGV